MANTSEKQQTTVKNGDKTEKKRRQKKREKLTKILNKNIEKLWKTVK